MSSSSNIIKTMNPQNLLLTKSSVFDYRAFCFNVYSYNLLEFNIHLKVWFQTSYVSRIDK